jgi:hypothetical protein
MSMHRSIRVFAVVVATLFFLAATTQAAVVVRIAPQSGPIFAAPGGPLAPPVITSFDVFISSTATSTDSMISLDVDFFVPSGPLFRPALTPSDVGYDPTFNPHPAGAFTVFPLNEAASSFSFNGQLSGPPLQGSSFTVDPDSSRRRAPLVLDFLAPTSPLASETRFARIDLDISGVAPGTYDLIVENVNPTLLTGTGIGVIGNPGGVQSFTITAVPEPSSLALLGLVGSLSFLRRRR